MRPPLSSQPQQRLPAGGAEGQVFRKETLDVGLRKLVVADNLAHDGQPERADGAEEEGRYVARDAVRIALLHQADVADALASLTLAEGVAEMLQRRACGVEEQQAELGAKVLREAHELVQHVLLIRLHRVHVRGQVIVAVVAGQEVFEGVEQGLQDGPEEGVLVAEVVVDVA